MVRRNAKGLCVLGGSKLVTVLIEIFVILDVNNL